MWDSQKLSSNMKARHKFPIQGFQKSEDQHRSFDFGTSFVVLSFFFSVYIRHDHILSSSTTFASIPSLFLDLVRPFLDLVRCHARSVVFVLHFAPSFASELTDIQLGLCSSSLPPNSSSPSLSIPPELFHNYLKLQAHHSKIFHESKDSFAGVPPSRVLLSNEFIYSQMSKS
ncbi:hypothetical protein DVH24_041253 [Malus domestica]|uniref:Uncharacterized protein n=1 Tax=Malus domestica TaxID=3750 RepID=A0A498I9I8_MALDO|nr:hypothetical protein DVH24_041253 [Malus domestica]